MAERDAAIHSQPADIFNAARRLTDPAARRAYLDEACADAMHDWAWRNWLHCEIFHREAEKVLAK